MIRKICTVFALFLFAGTVIATPLTVTRILPSAGYKGSTIDVTLSVVCGIDKPNGVIIKEYVPFGWTIKSATPTAAINSTIGEIKWMFWGGDLENRTLSYTIQIPNSTGIAEFHGEFLYNDKDKNPITLNTSGAKIIDIIASQVVITVNRGLPGTVMVGNTFTAVLRVGVDLKGPNAPNGLIIKEYIPVGWDITTSTPASNSINASIGEIKWVITKPTGITNMTVYYTAKVPDTEAINGSRAFNGVFLYTFEDLDTSKDITGNAVVTVIPVPGDKDGDNKVGDFELLDFIEDWAQGGADDFALLSAIDVWASS